MTGVKTCSASLVCESPPVGLEWGLMNVGGVNASCFPITYVGGATFTINLIAMANTTASGTRECRWSFSTRFDRTSGTVSIGTADGLPVELLEFDIDE